MKNSLAAGLIVLALAAAPARATERDLALDYNVYIGGINTIELAFKSTLAPERYALDMKLRAGNFLRLFFKATMNAFSEGRIAAGETVPLKAGTDSVWNGRKRQIRLIYGAPGAPPRAETIPPVKQEDRTPVTEEMKRDTRDLTAAVLKLLTAIGRDGRCDARARVFDGRRRYNITLAEGKHVSIRKNGYSAYHGEALRCLFVMDRLGGYRRDLDHPDKPTNDKIYVWFARPFAGEIPVPVRMEFGTRFGELVAHLTGGRLENAGNVVTLKEPD